MKTSVALIGFMGTGKTAVGKVLAEKLGKEFVELDPLIVEKAGKAIPRIFAEDGEITFRELEIAVTKDVSGNKNVVIACGGGVPLNKINIDRLSQEAVIVYLTATPNVIFERTSADKEERPLLKVKEPTHAIRALQDYRKPFYERAADITINTSGLDIDGVARKIIDKLKKYEGFTL